MSEHRVSYSRDTPVLLILFQHDAEQEQEVICVCLGGRPPYERGTHVGAVCVLIHENCNTEQGSLALNKAHPPRILKQA